jgi:hypothetical protein
MAAACSGTCRTRVAINVLNSAAARCRPSTFAASPAGRQRLSGTGSAREDGGHGRPHLLVLPPGDGSFGWKHRHTNEANALPSSNALAPHATQAEPFSPRGAGTGTNPAKVGKVWGPAETAAPSTEYDTKNVTTETGMQAVSRTVGVRLAIQRYSSVKSNYMFQIKEDGVSTGGGVVGTAFFNGWRARLQARPGQSTPTGPKSVAGRRYPTGAPAVGRTW